MTQLLPLHLPTLAMWVSDSLHVMLMFSLFFSSFVSIDPSLTCPFKISSGLPDVDSFSSETLLWTTGTIPFATVIRYPSLCGGVFYVTSTEPDTVIAPNSTYSKLSTAYTLNLTHCYEVVPTIYHSDANDVLQRCFHSYVSEESDSAYLPQVSVLPPDLARVRPLAVADKLYWDFALLEPPSSLLFTELNEFAYLHEGSRVLYLAYYEPTLIDSGNHFFLVGDVIEARLRRRLEKRKRARQSGYWDTALFRLRSVSYPFVTLEVTLSGTNTTVEFIEGVIHGTVTGSSNWLAHQPEVVSVETYNETTLDDGYVVRTVVYEFYLRTQIPTYLLFHIHSNDQPARRAGYGGGSNQSAPVLDNSTFPVLVSLVDDRLSGFVLGSFEKTKTSSGSSESSTFASAACWDAFSIVEKDMTYKVRRKPESVKRDDDQVDQYLDDGLVPPDPGPGGPQHGGSGPTSKPPPPQPPPGVSHQQWRMMWRMWYREQKERAWYDYEQDFEFSLTVTLEVSYDAVLAASLGAGTDCFDSVELRHPQLSAFRLCDRVLPSTLTVPDTFATDLYSEAIWCEEYPPYVPELSQQCEPTFYHLDGDELLKHPNLTCEGCSQLKHLSAQPSFLLTLHTPSFVAPSGDYEFHYGFSIIPRSDSGTMSPVSVDGYEEFTLNVFGILDAEPGPAPSGVLVIITGIVFIGTTVTCGVAGALTLKAGCRGASAMGNSENIPTLFGKYVITKTGNHFQVLDCSAKYMHKDILLKKPPTRDYCALLKLLRASKYSSYAHCRHCYTEQQEFARSSQFGNCQFPCCCKCGLPLMNFVTFTTPEMFCVVCAVANKYDHNNHGRCLIHLAAPGKSVGATYYLYQSMFSVSSASKKKRESPALHRLDCLTSDPVWKLNAAMRFEYLYLVRRLIGRELFVPLVDEDGIEAMRATIEEAKERQQVLRAHQIRLDGGFMNVDGEIDEEVDTDELMADLDLDDAPRDSPTALASPSSQQQPRAPGLTLGVLMYPDHNLRVELARFPVDLRREFFERLQILLTRLVAIVARHLKIVVILQRKRQLTGSYGVRLQRGLRELVGERTEDEAFVDHIMDQGQRLTGRKRRRTTQRRRNSNASNTSNPTHHRQQRRSRRGSDASDGSRTSLHHHYHQPSPASSSTPSSTTLITRTTPPYVQSSPPPLLLQRPSPNLSNGGVSTQGSVESGASTLDSSSRTSEGGAVVDGVTPTANAGVLPFPMLPSASASSATSYHQQFSQYYYAQYYMSYLASLPHQHQQHQQHMLRQQQQLDDASLQPPPRKRMRHATTTTTTTSAPVVNRDPMMMAPLSLKLDLPSTTTISSTSSTSSSSNGQTSTGPHAQSHRRGRIAAPAPPPPPPVSYGHPPPPSGVHYHHGQQQQQQQYAHGLPPPPPPPTMVMPPPPPQQHYHHHQHGSPQSLMVQQQQQQQPPTHVLPPPPPPPPLPPAPPAPPLLDIDDDDLMLGRFPSFFDEDDFRSFSGGGMGIGTWEDADDPLLGLTDFL